MKGLVALITGGASGLGLACAQRFVRQGARVIICDLPTSKGSQVVQALTDMTQSVAAKSNINNPDDEDDQLGSNSDDYTNVDTTQTGNVDLEEHQKLLRGQQIASDTSSSSSSSSLSSQQAIFYPGDVTNENDVQQIFDRIKQTYDRLDVVVNCAGIACAFRTYNINKRSMHGLGEFQKVINVNVSGTFNVLRRACHLMADNQPNENGQRGVIINTASVAGYEGQIGQVAYAASKGAIASMTLPLARDLSNMGVRVCAIAPGVFHTSILNALPIRVKLLLGNMVPFPSRVGKPDEFAHMAQSIIENPYLNGEVIRLDDSFYLIQLQNMQQRTRNTQKSQFGIILLIFELTRASHIPPITLVIIGLNILIYWDMIPISILESSDLESVCLSTNYVYDMGQYSRLFFAPLFHGDDMHLYYNMVSFLFKGQQLETLFGSKYFAILVFVCSLSSSIMIVLLGQIASVLFENPSFASQCAIGFSAVIFALKVITTHYTPADRHYVWGIPVPTKYAVWAELFIIQFITPNVSFLGHLAGIIVGLLYVNGPIQYICESIFNLIS
ncbi:unnamed protein product [Didymodactylos carnosus]|uniref:Peptidase S54 rhomboid domain-containing protein n=1 Tax=Didymodactylos carnosus TaxID=1234261 RepID=A0A815CM10_9BILA|nr:unnamed protein product [Didymodactylos carnosus]CAF1282100.1 unnamed protein product [Didymodactylos carnosus]CAF3866543.1 unnamed protein product [Didymodactylos carnosus]CAF4078226.1 unnamed protein product [Didymodactylos carnosus]